MEQKKSWYGYIFLALSAVLIGMILSAGMESIGTFYLYGNFKKLSAAFLFLLLFFALRFLAGSFARSGLPAYFEENKRKTKVLVFGAVAAIVAAAMLAQYRAMLRLPDLSVLGSDVSVYQKAALKLLYGDVGHMLELFDRSPVYGYGKVLSLLYGFTGTFPMAAVYLGLFFFGVNLLLVYGVGRLMLGRGAGLAALLVYAFLPTHIGLAAAPGNAGLGYPAFYGTVMLAGLYCFLLSEGALRTKGTGIFLSAASGVLMGYACFLNPVSWGILAALALWRTIRGRYGTALLTLALCAGLFFLLQYGRAADLNVGMGPSLSAYAGEAGGELALYGESAHEYLNQLSLRFEMVWGREAFAGTYFDRQSTAPPLYPVDPWRHQLAYMTVLSFSLLSLALAWKRRKDGPFLPVVAAMGAVLLLSAWGFHQQADSAAFYSLLALTAGACAQLLYQDAREREQEEEREEAQEIRALEERFALAESAGEDMEEIGAAQEQTAPTGSTAEKAEDTAETKGQAVPTEGAETAPADSPQKEVRRTVESEKGKRPVKYIENPLPVPKRHVPRVMDFDITQIGKEEYDIQVSDTDDYDL